MIVSPPSEISFRSSVIPIIAGIAVVALVIALVVMIQRSR